MSTRPDWDTYFVGMCNFVATRSTCDRKHVGAVIVQNKRVISTGYNGSIQGLPHCSDPEEFWQCTRCGKKFDEEPKEMHRLECAGYPMIKKYGGHDLVDNHCVSTSHAEINAVAQAARMGVATEGATIYCNTRPCYTCFKTIIAAGITEIVYDSDYDAENTDRIDTIVKDLPNFIFRKYQGKQSDAKPS